MIFRRLALLLSSVVMACVGGVLGSELSADAAGPGLEVLAYIDGRSADMPPGANVTPGRTAHFVLVIRNNTRSTVTDIELRNTALSPELATCASTQLLPGQKTECVGSAVIGQGARFRWYSSVTARLPDGGQLSERNVCYGVAAQQTVTQSEGPAVVVGPDSGNSRPILIGIIVLAVVCLSSGLVLAFRSSLWPSRHKLDAVELPAEESGEQPTPIETRPCRETSPGVV